MRYLVSLVCVLALGVMPMVGCSDEETTGGTGGDGGVGGGVLTVCVPGEDAWQPCRTGDDEPGFCIQDECQAAEFSCVDVPWSVCADADTWPEDPGICVNDMCELLVESCTEQEDGTPCFALLGWGICDVGVCSLEPDGE